MIWIGLNLKLYKSSEILQRGCHIWTLHLANMKVERLPTIQSALSFAKIKWFQIDEHYTITFNSTKICKTSTCSKMLYGTYKWAWECSIIFWTGP